MTNTIKIGAMSAWGGVMPPLHDAHYVSLCGGHSDSRKPPHVSMQQKRKYWQHNMRPTGYSQARWRMVAKARLLALNY